VLDCRLSCAHVSAPSRFLDFEVLTCAPIQTKLVDPTLLAPSELAFLNHYNGWCRQKVRVPRVP
jgi:hypothetical protein